MQASINAVRQKSSSLAWRFIRSNKITFDSSYPKVDCMNRYCVSSKEMHALPDTSQQNKPPLVKSSGKFNFYEESREKYPRAPDAVVALWDAVRTKNSSLVRNLIKFNEIDINYAFPPLANSVLHLAASLGFMDIVQILVEEGHASNYKNIYDIWPIHFAAQNNHMDLVQYFSDP